MAKPRKGVVPPQLRNFPKFQKGGGKAVPPKATKTKGPSLAAARKGGKTRPSRRKG